MAAFNGIHGVPCTGNPYLLTEILRNEMGFDGVTISDWGAVEELIKIGTAADDAHAAKLAMEAGVDIEMMSGAYVRSLEALVRNGTIPEARLDEAVYRVLTLKNKLGLFENNAHGTDAEKDAAPVPEAHVALARQMARESMVLLENRDDLLPLPRTGKRITLIGPYGNTKELNGS